jgi:hypothetical protein
MERKARPPVCGGHPQNFLKLNFPLGAGELVFGILANSHATQKTANCGSVKIFTAVYLRTLLKGLDPNR